jgi:Butirosin biosynthesis protein H, N-terminal
MQTKFSTITRRTFIFFATLLALCLPGPSLRAQSQAIFLLSPSQGTVFNACDALLSPSFDWETEETYKSLEIQFFVLNTSKKVNVKVRSPSERRLQLTPSVWKKVLLLPGPSGGDVNWKVVGTTVDRKKEESNALSFQIGAPDAVQDPAISPTDWSLPTLTWKTSCHAKFTVWFGADGSFTKSKKFSFTRSIPSEGQETFTYPLTSKDWNAIRNLVGHRSGARIYWFVEAWDGLKRRSVTEVMDFPLDISMDNLPPSVILDVPPRKTVAGFCYLESFSMQIAYLDSSATAEEVFTFAGMGSDVPYWSAGKSFLAFPGRDWTMMVHTRAIENYGAHFIVGHDVTGDDGDYMKGGALARTTYSGPVEALRYLKALIRSNRPVQVHIDLYYLPSLPKYRATQPGASHFVIVNGYDENSIFITETYLGERDKNQFKNVRIPVEEFMEAWWNGGVPPLQGFWGTTGPYWMVFLIETENSQLDKMSVTEALDMQREFSADNESTVIRYAASDFSNTPWGAIARMKKLFGDYLAANGYADAADACWQLAVEYESCTGLSTDDQRQKLINVIAPLEAVARTLY